jgi:hypothetical protein
MPVTESFSPSYAVARAKFLAAAASAGAHIRSHEHPLPGRDGETLAMDLALDGAPDAERLLIVSSACHGVEGYCGSGVQVHALRDPAWRSQARAQGVAVLYIHGLNPYGFSHLRRVTHENVDINRNFQDFSQPLPANPAYRELHALLLPEHWPPNAQNQAAMAAFTQGEGMKAFQAAVTGGQHEFPDGLFFGGTEPTWSNRTVRQVLREHCRQATRIAWIDLHTGLGPSGVGERICACVDDPVALQRARSWWDSGGATPVTSIYDGSSTSALLTGLMWFALYQECPQAEYTGIAIEYGTQPIGRVIQALRAEQWLQLHPQADAALAKSIKQDLLEAFYTDTDAWKERIVEQAMPALLQAVQGLSAGNSLNIG